MGRVTELNQKILGKYSGPTVLLILLYLCGAGCSEKRIGLLTSDSGSSNNEAIDSETNITLAWTGIWKGTADYIYRDQNNGYDWDWQTREYIYDWEKNKPCEITINSYSPKDIVFHMQKPIMFQVILSIDSDTTFNTIQNKSGFKVEARSTR